MKKQSQIITVPNPKLLEVTKPVTSFDSDFQKSAEILHRALKEADFGIGLAANQIGLNCNVFVVEYEDPKGKETIPLQFFVNPEIAEYSKEAERMEEGCLSVPSIFLDVVRPSTIKIKAQDLNGKKFKLTAKGLMSRLIQHEADHLQGHVFTEKASKNLHDEFKNLKNLKIVFIGTGAFAELILRGLILLKLNVVQIITEKGKPSGRNREIIPSLVADDAQIFGHNYKETDNIRDLKSQIENLKPDVIVLTDFGQIIPADILSIPKIAAINIHPSLLPKYRGATPIQTAILTGEKETGVSIIKMSPEIDKGEIIMQQKIEILEHDNYITLRDRLSNLSLKMLLELLPKMQVGQFDTIAQDDTKATKTQKLSKDMGLIDWKKKPAEIDRQIRAFFPWPGSFTEIDGKRMIIHEAYLDKDKLVIDIVQPEGKKPMEFSDFLKGYRGPKPAWFCKMTVKSS